MNQEELNKIVRLHGSWLDDEEWGKRADLRDANLGSADLRYANLRSANLRDANLRGANLRGAKTEFCLVNFSADEYEQAKQFIEGLEPAM